MFSCNRSLNDRWIDRKEVSSNAMTFIERSFPSNRNSFWRDDHAQTLIVDRNDKSIFDRICHIQNDHSMTNRQSRFMGKFGARWKLLDELLRSTQWVAHARAHWSTHRQRNLKFKWQLNLFFFLSNPINWPAQLSIAGCDIIHQSIEIQLNSNKSRKQSRLSSR